MRMSCTRILALFQKRIEGDDSMLHLAGLRFREAGLGAEFYAENPAELNRLMEFRPMPEGAAVVHVSREMNILEESHRNLIVDFASAFRNHIFGLVVHDQPEAATQKRGLPGRLERYWDQARKDAKQPASVCRICRRP